MDIINNSQQTTDVAWGDISSCEHIAHIYEDHKDFHESLSGYVAEGIKAFEGVIVIARSEHLAVLEQKLAAQNIDYGVASSENRYITRDAEQLLSTFLVDDSPDKELFFKAIVELLALAKGPGRKVRVFGEMVSILWECQETAATVKLEKLWHELIFQEDFSLLCAYPKSGFTPEHAALALEINRVHTSILENSTLRKMPGASGLP